VWVCLRVEAEGASGMNGGVVAFLVFPSPCFYIGENAWFGV
jgi:hypothetical protein